MSKDNGGPAFPVAIGSQHDQHYAAPGVTIRDYFAAKAMQGLLASGHSEMADYNVEYVGPDKDEYNAGLCIQLAEQAYALANAMLAARSTDQ